MNIYFKPTYLYIKQHNDTGLKYFGKTTSNPEKYKGSGLYWTAHLKSHGNNVSTIWYERFNDKESLTEYAIAFSKENNIVESTEWANLKPENGLDGGQNNAKWYNNGSDNILALSNPGPGWEQGRLHNASHNIGKKYYNNGIIQIFTASIPGTGWCPGMLPTIVKSRKTTKGMKYSEEVRRNNSLAQQARAPKYSFTHPIYGNFHGSIRALAELYPEQKLNKAELWKLSAGQFKNGYKGWEIKQS
jgi:hypothetical protein